jgi:hypothetical protein
MLIETARPATFSRNGGAPPLPLAGEGRGGALSQDSTMIKVTKLKHLGGHRLHAMFSDEASARRMGRAKAIPVNQKMYEVAFTTKPVSRKGLGSRDMDLQAVVTSRLTFRYPSIFTHRLE